MLTRDEATHTYFWDDKRVPGVTSVMAPLYDWLGEIPHHVLERKGAIGRATHKACELYDNGDINDREPLDPAVQPYFHSYVRWLDAEQPEILQNESFVYHAAHRYAGQLDRVVRLKRRYAGTWWIDLKTTSAISPAVGVQTMAYLMAQFAGMASTAPIEELSDPTFKPRRGALQLQPDGSTAKLVEFDDPEDFAHFLSLLNLHRWRERYAGR